MTKYYSPSMNGFTEIKHDDSVEIEHEEWLYLLEQNHSGKELYNNNGKPGLRDPVVTKEQQSEMAKNKKESLLSDAMSKMYFLQTKLLLGRISTDEKEVLNQWVDYIEQLESVDDSKPEKITWPEAPVT